MLHAKQHDSGGRIGIVSINFTVPADDINRRCPQGRGQQQAVGGSECNLLQGIFFRESFETL